MDTWFSFGEVVAQLWQGHTIQINCHWKKVENKENKPETYYYMEIIWFTRYDSFSRAQSPTPMDTVMIGR